MDVDQPHRQPWRLDDRGQWWFDVVLATGLLLPVVALAVTGADLSWTVLGLAQLVPLYWRRHHSLRVFAVVAIASAAQALVLDSPLWSQVAFPVATYSVARYSAALPAALALGVGGCGAVVASVDWLRSFDQPLEVIQVGTYVAFISAIVATAWALGTQGRTRRAYVDALLERGERIVREAEQRAELAASAERSRIAREMHDIVAHGLSVIVVQADGARYAAEADPRVATATLETIAATGREALTEMRRLLGLLRAGDETGWRPQPGLGDLPQLVAEARAGGTEVEAALPPSDVEVPDGIALTAYRVVQEALSNVRKHAGPGAAVSVEVTVGADVAVTVEDDGRGAGAVSDRAGLGLVGMRERVTVHGGAFAAGPRPGGGFRVSARLPR